MSGMNRRDFIKNTATGLGGLLVLDTLEACRPSEPGVTSTAPFSFADDVHSGFPLEFTERTVPTTCWIGKQDCGMLARVVSQEVNGQTIERIVKLEGNPRHPRNNGKLCPKGVAQLQAIYDYNRLKWPLRRINAKGEPGRFVRISWAEALDEVKAELDDAKANKKPFMWQKGRSKAKGFYDDGFQKALASWGGDDMVVSKFGHGAYCSDSGYRAAEYTLGYHGVISPDFSQTKYLLSWGWGMTTSGGNKFCWLTWPQKFLEARNREENPLQKVVVFDPNRRQTGPHGQEWLPNRPGSDLAFFLGIAHYLVTQTASGFEDGLIDKTYLLNHTNGPFLVFGDKLSDGVTDDPHKGKIVLANASKVIYDPTDATHHIDADLEKARLPEFKQWVWDTTTASAVQLDATGATPTLFGTTYTWTDSAAAVHTVKPGFQLYKEHLTINHTEPIEQTEHTYTPAWADGICDLPPMTTARIARELFENATIGATIKLKDGDGNEIELPHRPVSMMAYHVSQQELGFPAIRAGINVFQLLGAIDVPGGIQVDFGPSGLYKNWAALDSISVDTDDDYKFDLGKTKYFPISSGCPSFFHRTQLDPERYKVDESTIPKKVMLHMVDPARSFTDSPVIRKAYSQFEHVTAIQPWMSETADLFADLILPAATIEKYEGPMSGKTADEKADALRLPPVAPLWESKGEIDIYLDIAEKVGFLDTFIGKINTALALAETEHEVSTGSKPTPRAIFDNWAKYKGKSGIDYFEENGVTDTSVKGADSKYSSAAAYHGARHRLYGERLVEYGAAMTGAGITAGAFPHVADYSAFPTWRAPTMWGSAGTHPLHLLSHKQVEFKQSRASFVPILAELSPRQGLIMNAARATEMELADGDEVIVESHNAMTQETRRVKTRLVLRQTIRPDTVSMSHHYGINVTPTNRGQGPSPNELYFAGEGYIQCTQDASFHVMVRVYKA